MWRSLKFKGTLYTPAEGVNDRLDVGLVKDRCLTGGNAGGLVATRRLNGGVKGSVDEGGGGTGELRRFDVGIAVDELELRRLEVDDEDAVTRRLEDEVDDEDAVLRRLEEGVGEVADDRRVDSRAGEPNSSTSSTFRGRPARFLRPSR